MALVIFLRGINVGGHKTFRPSLLARELNELSDLHLRLDMVNVGGAGTFVVRNRISQAKLRAEVLRRLPFQAEAVVCKGADILALVSDNPFAGQRTSPNIVRFVSMLAKPARPLSSTPLSLPSTGQWSVKILGRKGQFVLGLYRREMRTIRYLGQLDEIFGAPATTRNWNTITGVAKILESS